MGCSGGAGAPGGFPSTNCGARRTFSTNGIAHIGQSPSKNPSKFYTVGRFLTGCATTAYNLRFSGRLDPLLHAAVNADILMSGINYGFVIAFTGLAGLTNGDEINILHDDGVSLKIEGNPVAGFDPKITAPVLESVPFVGTTGSHQFDLLNANAKPGGAGLLFFLIFTEAERRQGRANLTMGT